VAQGAVVEAAVAREQRRAVEAVQERDDLVVVHAAPADVVADLADTHPPAAQELALLGPDVLVKDVHSRAAIGSLASSASRADATASAIASGVTFPSQLALIAGHGSRRATCSRTSATRIRVPLNVSCPWQTRGFATTWRPFTRTILAALRLTPFAPEFPTMRYDAILKDAVARVGAVRETVGEGVDTGIEIHRRLAPGEAIALAAELEPLRPLYYEDPILPDSVQSGAENARPIRLPIATGERLVSVFEFREPLAGAAARYLRVDACLAGGISHTRKIAAVAESFHAGIMPHGANSTAATAIAVQLDACIPNFVLQDYLGDDQPPKSDFLVENLRLDGGYLVVPERPGLGVELKPDISARYPPTTRAIDTALHEDGSVADR